MKRPASVISVQDGDIMVDAEFLAAKLGLSTESLKAEMRRGFHSDWTSSRLQEQPRRL